MPYARENGGNIKSLLYVRGCFVWLFVLCQLNFTFWEHDVEENGHSGCWAGLWSLNGGRSHGRQWQYPLMAGQESWEFTPKKGGDLCHRGTVCRRHQDRAGSTAHSGTTVVAMPPKPVWMPWYIWSSGVCPWGGLTIPPLSRPSPVVKLLLQCSKIQEIKLEKLHRLSTVSNYVCLLSVN